jgi:REP-associated tyrosine transposase
MARQPRLIVPDLALHIVQRGVDRQDCFNEETDRLVYLSLLRELCAQTHCAVHAYCLMTNHVHLLLTPLTADGPSVLMRKLGQRYVPYFNRRYERTGTLWQGRFKSCLVESARYVLGCHRYIECNPARAGMVPHPGAYRWSSYDANVGLAEDPLLTPHVEYLALGLDHRASRAAYRGLFDDALDPTLVKAIREATQGGYPLVGDAMKDRLARQAKRKLERCKPGPAPARRSGPDPESRSGPDPELVAEGSG